MKVYTIKKDTISLFVDPPGGRGRPLVKTRIKEGDKVAAFSFQGSLLVGVGKNGACKRSDYLEYWCSCGTWWDEEKGKELSKQGEQENFNYCLEHYLPDFQRYNRNNYKQKQYD